MSARGRALALAAVALAVAAALAAWGPIAQFADYHRFADERTLFHVRNFADSASNLPFLVIGLAGIAYCLRAGRGAAWTAVFAGAIAIAFGSTYYHQAPDDARLVWDRLPIALTFMAFLVALLEDHLERPPGVAALLGALALGAAGVFY